MKIRLMFGAVLLCFSLVAALPTFAHGRPSDSYKFFLQKVYFAKTLKDIAPCMMNSTREHWESLEGREEREMFKLWKTAYVAKFKLIKEEVITDRAYIEGEGVALERGQRVKAHVRAQMVQEGGSWKVMYSNWSGVARGK